MCRKLLAYDTLMYVNCGGSIWNSNPLSSFYKLFLKKCMIGSFAGAAASQIVTEAYKGDYEFISKF